jgi:putative FmdB family regulatory protein
MPTYDYTCAKCGHEETLVRRLAERDNAVVCEVCGEGLQRVLVYATAVRPDYEPYISPASGKLIEGRQAHIEDLKRTGCRIYEPGETEHFIKQKAARQADYERRVEAVVDAAAADIGIA